MADTGRPVVFQPGATCPTGYLCIPGMEPIKLPDIQGDTSGLGDPPQPVMPPLTTHSHSDLYWVNPWNPSLSPISKVGFDPSLYDWGTGRLITDVLGEP